MGMILPSEYQEVEYIESTGTQYINTEILPSATDVYSFRGWFRNISNSVLFGCRSSGTYVNADQLYLNRNISDTTKAVFLIVNSASTYSSDYTKNIFFNTGDDLPLWIDEKDISINGRTHTSFNPTQPIYLLGFNMLGSNNGSVGGGKLSYFKIAGRCEFIPCYHKTSGEIGMYDLVSDTFYTNSGTGTFLKGGDVIRNTPNLLDIRRRILLNTPHTETISGAMASFSTDMRADLKECKIYFSPIQASGTPSPDNPLPISGWDGVTVTRCGKNLFSGNVYSAGHGINSVGEITENSVYDVYQQNYKSGTYTVMWSDENKSANKSLRIVDYDESGNVLSVTERSYTTASDRILAFTVNSQAVVTMLSIRSSVIECRILKGEMDTAVPYEPHTETTYTIPFSQTIYGGYVDLVRGEVVEDHAIIPSSNWAQVRQNNGYIAYQATPPGIVNFAIGSVWYSNMIGEYGSFNSTSMNKNIIQKATVGGKVFLALDENADVTNLQVIVQLATPNTYTLTPETIKALKGINNIWSNANGNIEVSYFTH